MLHARPLHRGFATQSTHHVNFGDKKTKLAVVLLQVALQSCGLHTHRHALELEPDHNLRRNAIWAARATRYNSSVRNTMSVGMACLNACLPQIMVSPGHMRNYLYERRIAVYATPENIRKHHVPRSVCLQRLQPAALHFFDQLMHGWVCETDRGSDRILDACAFCRNTLQQTAGALSAPNLTFTGLTQNLGPF